VTPTGSDDDKGGALRPTGTAVTRRYGGPAVVTNTEACMRGILLAVGAALVLGACSGDGGSDVDERQAAIYAAAIETVASEAGSAAMPFDGPVYVVASPGHDIGIEIQVEVVEQIDDVTIRFVDERDEAIKESDDDAPVLGDGLLVTLGKVRGSGGRRTVLLEAYVRSDDDERYAVTLERRDGRWVVTDQASRAS
jgi:hypothetical protein